MAKIVKTEDTAVDTKQVPEVVPVAQSVVKAVVTEVKKIDDKKLENRIYIGPSFPTMELNRGTIFKVVPKNILKLIEKCPSIEELLVKTKELKVKTDQASKKGTKENQDYNKILEFIKKGGK